MAEIVNMTRFKKQRRRRLRSEAAEENRTRHGETKPEKTRRRADERSRARELEGNRIESPAKDEPV